VTVGELRTALEGMDQELVVNACVKAVGDLHNVLDVGFHALAGCATAADTTTSRSRTSTCLTRNV